MFQLLWLVVAIPFDSAVLLALFGSRLSRNLLGTLMSSTCGFG